MADEYTTPPTAGNKRFPRVIIEFCTQCKWLLRAAYYAQELLSTFSTSLGEVALQPSTGGTFIVTIDHQTTQEEGASVASDDTLVTKRTVLWDRKVDEGFPETKELKRRVRDVIEPGRDLGHVDRNHTKPVTTTAAAAAAVVEKEAKPEEQDKTVKGKKECEDCN